MPLMRQSPGGFHPSHARSLPLAIAAAVLVYAGSHGLELALGAASASRPSAARTAPTAFTGAAVSFDRGHSRDVARRAVQTCSSVASLDEAIASTAGGGILVVSFSTTWCGPCKLMEPKVEELSDAYSGRARFAKVVGDKGSGGALMLKREGVRAVPYYAIYKGAQKIDSVSGADPSALENALARHTEV